MLIQLAAVCFLAAMSPGPDFVLVSRYALSFGRKTAFFATLGIGSAVCIHAWIASIGANYLSNGFAWNVIKYLGSSYLAFIALQVFWQFFRSNDLKVEFDSRPLVESRTNLDAFMKGFLTNALNPKAVVFFAGVCAPLIAKNHFSVLSVVATIGAAAVLWFSFLSYFLGTKSFRGYLQKYLKCFECIFAVFLLYFSYKILVS